MLDTNLLRKDLLTVISRLESRKTPQPFFSVKNFQELEADRKNVQVQTETLQSQRNALAKQIGQLKARAQDCAEPMAQAQLINEVMDELTRRLATIQLCLNNLLQTIPNLPHESVPPGRDEAGNVEVRKWSPLAGFGGAPCALPFPPKDHVDMGQPMGLDFEMGVKLTGSRFTVMTGPLARLHRALTQFMLDVQTIEHGYTECYVPYIVNSDSLRATAQLPKFEEDLFKTQKGGQEGHLENAALYLIPTSEVPLTNFVRDEIVNEADLPLKFTAHTPCFRSEAGSYGRDPRGMLRQHQFYTVEMVQIVHPDKSDATLEAMTWHAEAILQKLGLAYRVMLLCTGDMGFSAAKTYDLEVWLPGQSAYREISSVSNCQAFQARRLQARFKNAQGKNEFVHTLNGSGLAVGRTLVAIIENYQCADGSVEIPLVLQPYMGGLKHFGVPGSRTVKK